MILLVIFAFLAGIVTILSPCILPLMPIVLSSTIGGQDTGKSRPMGIVLGFILSFTFFTLFLSTIVRFSGIPADTFRLLSVVVIAGFGVSFLIPKFQLLLEQLFSRLSKFVPVGNTKTGFWSGIVVGISLGLLWTPCVGPILASVISLSFTGTVSLDAFFITLAYSLGTAIPMFAIIIGGQNILKKVPWLLANTGRIQKAFGVVMILTALGIFFNIDRKFQTYMIQTFPGYGVGLNKFQDIPAIKNALKKLESKPAVQPKKSSNPLSFLEPDYGEAPEFILGGKWFNSAPLTMKELRGKVVLVDFWTYTCINCIRTFPYLKSLHQKYKDKGLVIVGVHTPEFEFEKNPDNVVKAIKDFGLEYPIMQDNEYATWQAYNNRYWPAEYFIDKNGRIRRMHFGEGEYNESEEFIQKLLIEAGQQVSSSLENLPDQTPKTRNSPETYLGSARMQYYYPGGSIRAQQQSFILADNLPKNSFSLGGEWEITDEYAIAGENAMLNYNFTANKVFLVLRPGTSGGGKIKVFIDGKPADSSNAGEDVTNGIVTVDTDRLYTLVDLKGKPGNHILRLEFQTLGIEAFAFTFG